MIAFVQLAELEVTEGSSKSAVRPPQFLFGFGLVWPKGVLVRACVSNSVQGSAHVDGVTVPRMFENVPPSCGTRW